jgi:DNA polymerase-3 subunit epsilon
MVNLAQVLHLTRSLTVFDLESTGTNPDTDRVIQIGVTKHYPDKDPVPYTTYVNPGMPIPPESTAVHHITDAMVKDAPSFKAVGMELAFRAFVNTDYVGYNVLYDLRLFRSECRRAEIAWDWERDKALVVDAHRLYQIIEPRSLTAAYVRFVKKSPEAIAHHAGHDVVMTEEVLWHQLHEFPGIPRHVTELSDYCFPVRPGFADRSGKFKWQNGVLCFAFGKWNGRPVADYTKYLEWMLAGDFPEDSKEICRAVLRGETLTP